MHELSDAQLLRDYAAHGNEAAFREIVNRHAALVYSSALRQVTSPDLARDVAQSIFTDLARKAPALAETLTENSSLIGWLYRSTRFTALNLLREDRRRLARERQVMQHFDPATETAPDWDQVQPVLDEAMADLSDEDRDALLLRYFKNHDFRAIGSTLGVSDDAAQKRVSRALERLRAHLTNRGVTTTALALSTTLAANAVPLAPAGLAATLSTTALAGTTLAASVTITATKAIAMTTIQKALVAATLAVLAGAGIYEARQASQLREQNQTLQQQQVPLSEQVGLLSRALEDATNQIAVLRNDNERLNRNTGELAKLRGELARNRISNQELADDPTALAAKSWLMRVNKLKQRIQDDPRQAIPELRFVSEDNWLSAAMNRLETERDFRQALSTIRGIGSSIAAEKFKGALHRFMAANNDQFPTDIGALAGHLSQNMDESILSRWEVRRASEIKNHGLKCEWVIMQKDTVDEAYDWQWLANSNETTSIQAGELGRIDKAAITVTLEPVRQAFAAANGGRDPKSPAEVLPYATTPEQKETLQTMIRLYEQHHSPTNQTR